MPQSPFEATVLPLRMFRITCGDGEGDETETGKTTTTETDNGDGTTSSTTTTETEGADLESQLDAERSARIQLQRERDEQAEAAAQALRETAEDGDRVAAERDDYKQKYEKLKGLMETSYLTNAIAKSYQAPGADGKGGKGFDFHDPEAVRTFINPKNIRLDMDTGEVEGLKEELKRIAREKPYLVKPVEQQDSGSGGNFQPPPGSTGAHPRGGSTTRQPTTDAAALARKYKMPGISGVTARF